MLLKYLYNRYKKFYNIEEAKKIQEKKKKLFLFLCLITALMLDSYKEHLYAEQGNKDAKEFRPGIAPVGLHPHKQGKQQQADAFPDFH